MGRFSLRKKQAGRSTQLEFVTVENEGVLKHAHREIISGREAYIVEKGCLENELTKDSRLF